MSLQHLRTFVEVHRRRSISEAARILGLTQPGVSAHVAALEASIGRALFVRHARGVRPTAAADELAARLGDGLDRAEATLAAMKARSSRMTGVAHLCGPAEFLSERVAPVLPRLLEAGLDLRIRMGDRERIYAMLLEGEADLAFTASPPDDARLAFQRVGAEALVAVVQPDRAGEGLAGPFVAYDLDLPLIRQWLAGNDLPAPAQAPAATAPDLRLLRAMAIAGAGWTVLPDYLCDAAVSAGRLVEIPAPRVRPMNDFNLVWTKGALRHPRVAFARNRLLDALADIA